MTSAAAIPNRQKMLAVLRKASETGDGVEAPPDTGGCAGRPGPRVDRAPQLPQCTEAGPSDAWYAAWLLVHSGARADPRFKELMREGGLAEFWRQSGKWPDVCGPVGEDDFECH